MGVKESICIAYLINLGMGQSLGDPQQPSFHFHPTRNASVTDRNASINQICIRILWNCLSFLLDHFRCPEYRRARNRHYPRSELNKVGMPPKKVDDATVTKELAATVRRIYKSDERDQLTVNYARQVVQEKLGLRGDFFKDDAWKERSKQIIHTALVRHPDRACASPLWQYLLTRYMQQADVQNDFPSSPPKREPDPTPDPSPKKVPKKAANKNGPKKAVSKNGTPKKETKKRAKKEPTSNEESEGEESATSLSEIVPKPKKRKLLAGRGKRVVDSDEGSGSNESSEDDFVSSSEEERPRKKAKPTAPKPKRKSAEKLVADSDTGSPLSELESDKDDASASPTTLDQSQPTKSKSDNKSNPTKVDSDNESDMSIVYDEPPKRKPKTKKAKKESEPKTKDVSGSDTSEVFDETPKKKKRGKAKDNSAKKGRKAQSATPADQSPDDALIKQLQGQLVKCGVRKIWGIELKKYGGDKGGKIRHLKNMLTEIGMTGRFSDARAKEIKERRELMADLDAVREGEKNWGVNQGRARRGAVKNLKEPSDEESSGQLPDAEKSGDDSEDVQVHKRGPTKLRADLAFLGDESESD